MFGGMIQMMWNNEVQSLTGYYVGYCVEEDFLENINLIAPKKTICFFCIVETQVVSHNSLGI